MIKEKEESMEEMATDRDDIIALMGVYLNEWEHRDELLWTQVFRYFYATLIVTVLPNAATFIGIDLPKVNVKIFPIIGLVMSIVFLYVGLGYAIRLRASSRTYEKMMNLLNDERYKRISIKDNKLERIFSVPMAFVLVVTMFIALVAVAVLFLVV